MKKFDNKQRRNFSLDDGNEEDFVPVDVYKVVMRSGYNRRDVVGFHRFLPSFEKVIAYRTAYHALPVFLQEYVSSVVDQEHTVDHDGS